MGGLYLRTLTLIDITLAFFITLVVFLCLHMAKRMNGVTKTEWIPRKLVHITISSTIAFSLPFFNSLSGPIYTILLIGVGFLALIACGNNLQEFLQVGTRKGEHLIDTFLASSLSIVSFGIVYLSFNSEPFVYISAILFTSWGDGAGEIFGRTIGKHKINKFYIHKTLEGALGVFTLSLFAIFISCILFWDISKLLTLQCFPIVISISIVISIIEFLSVKWVDNLTIPIIGALLLHILYTMV